MHEAKGTVRSNPAGINLNSDAGVTKSQQRQFAIDSQVYLLVKADDGWVVDESNATDNCNFKDLDDPTDDANGFQIISDKVCQIWLIPDPGFGTSVAALTAGSESEGDHTTIDFDTHTAVFRARP